MPAIRPAERRPPTDDHLTEAILQPEQLPTGISYRTPAVADGGAIWDLARRSGSLDLNSPYAYLLLCLHFPDTSVVATVDDQIVGFVVGYRPPTAPDVAFVWQIAVDDAHRGAGIASHLLGELVERAVPAGVRYLEATVTPSNDASARLFTAVATRLDTELEITTLFTNADFPVPEHEPELLFRIGPF